MSLLKNDVGRPSNDIKRKRRILICLLVFVFLLPLITLLVIDKNTKKLNANAAKKEKLEVYAYTKLPSTPNYSIKDEDEKKKGNRTFNLQDFDIYNGYIYFSKQSRGSCTKEDPKDCSDLLKQVILYKVKYDSKNKSKYYDSKELDNMILDNSGHGTILNHISSKTNTYLITGISELEDNNGLKSWNDKYIGTSKYFALVTFYKNKKTDLSTRSNSNKYKAIIEKTGDKTTYSKYIYDIGVDEKRELLSIRNDRNVYIYNYDFKKTGRLSIGVPNYTVKVDKGAKQGHDIYKNNIYVLFNDKIDIYDYKNDTQKTYNLSLDDLIKAVKNSVKLDHKVTNYEFEGIKVYNDKIYIGCKVSLKEEKATKIYSFIFEFNPEEN